jgi:transcriptional regulator with XRE-family HTH domain
MTVAIDRRSSFGGLLRGWRQTRHVSQLELSSVSGVSSRHLSFIETGRATPSRAMVLRLARELDVPLRERNTLLQAAGYAPEFGERSFDDPEMAAVVAALDTLLSGHLPYPALVFDRHHRIVRANSAAGLFTDGLPAHLNGPDANTMRITLHPDGLAADLVDHAEIRARFIGRIRRQAAASGDEVLTALADECAAYPHPPEPDRIEPASLDIVTPFRLRRDGRVVSMFSAVATFGTVTDLTAAELAIETFFPADEDSGAYLRKRFSEL